MAFDGKVKLGAWVSNRFTFYGVLKMTKRLKE